MTRRSGGQRIHLDSAILSRIAELRPVQLRAHVACVAWYASTMPGPPEDVDSWMREYRPLMPIPQDRLCRALVRCGIEQADAEKITKMKTEDTQE